MTEPARSPSRETIGTIPVDGVAQPIEMDPGGSRFEVRVGDHVAFVAFHLHGSTLALVHTEVPSALRGKGLADALARAALDYARDRSMRVKPYCAFVAGYIKRHQQYRNLVDPEFPVASPSPGGGS